MKVGNIKISSPYINYKALVKHHTSRKSTAIEWGILELVKNFKGNNQIQNISLDMIFQQILRINDTDELIKPCLVDLQDLGAVSIYNLSDYTSLKDIKVEDIELTSEGDKMQKDGKLPGAEKEEIISVQYNVIEKKLVTPKKLVGTGNGYKAIDMESINEVAFPRILIKNMLEGEKSKKKTKYVWLEATTEIKGEIREIESRIVWEDYNKGIEIDSDSTIRIQGIDENSEINAILFENEDNTAIGENITNEIHMADIDEFESINFIEDLPQVVISSINKLEKSTPNGKKPKTKNLFVFQDERFATNTPLSNVDVKIYFNSDVFNLALNKNSITVNIPSDITEKNCIFLSEKEALFAGYSMLYNSYGAKKFNLLYRLKNNDLHEREIVSKIVSRYMESDPNIILLASAKANDLALEKIEEYIKGKQVEQKLSFIKNIKAETNKRFGKNLNTEFLYEGIINDEVLAVGEVDSFGRLGQAYKVVNDYKSYVNPEIMNKIVKNLISRIEFVNSYNEIIAVKNLVYKDKKGRIEDLRHLYNENIIFDIYKNFLNLSEGRIDEITSIENVYNKLNTVCKNIDEYFGENKISDVLSENLILKTIVAQREKVVDLKEECEKFKEHIASLESQVDIEVLKKNMNIENAFDNIGKILDKLTLFINDDIGRYTKAVILDTCTMLDHFSEISQISKDTQIIIPNIVLGELDNLKGKSDEEKSNKAKKAINVIENLGEWVNFVDSDKDLIPEDLQECASNDMKILTVALKYIAYKTTLITEDINLRNIGKSQNLKTMGFEAFLREQKFNENTSNKASKKNKKDKKNKKK